MVTLMVAAWPGLMITGVTVVAGLIAASMMSPVSDVTEVLNCLACTVMDELTVPAGAGPGYGPHSLGAANQHEPLWHVPGQRQGQAGELIQTGQLDDRASVEARVDEEALGRRAVVVDLHGNGHQGASRQLRAGTVRQSGGADAHVVELDVAGERLGDLVPGHRLGEGHDESPGTGDRVEGVGG